MFDEFKKKYLGKAVDIDGLYGAQCVDLFNAWNRDYNGTYINCRPSGYARSLGENDTNNGILKYFTKCSLRNCIPGTVVIYGNCKFAPYSHVCFFISDNGNGTFKALNQNIGNKHYVTINNNPYDGVIGCYIPNQLLKKEVKESDHPLYVTLYNMYVRVSPTINSKIKKVKELTVDGQRNCTSNDKNADAVYKKGTKFTCYEIVKESNGRSWARTPSGYVCINEPSGRVYCSKI